MAGVRSPLNPRVVALAAVAIAVLALGTGVYVMDRGPGSITLFPGAWTGVGARGATFGAIGGSLPSFAHAFGFSLLTALALGPRPGAASSACAFWALAGTAFEVGQHREIAASWGAALHGPLHAVPGADALAAYFERGTFDPLDVAATVAGAIVAAIVLRARR